MATQNDSITIENATRSRVWYDVWWGGYYKHGAYIAPGGMDKYTDSSGEFNIIVLNRQGGDAIGQAFSVPLGQTVRIYDMDAGVGIARGDLENLPRPSGGTDDVIQG